MGFERRRTMRGESASRDNNIVEEVINTLGNLTVKISSQRTYSASQYNTNRYAVIEKTDKMEVLTEVTAHDLSPLERGHCYSAVRVAETAWKLHCPYRYADAETAKFGEGIRPIPNDEKLRDRWGDTCCRWQMVDREFLLSEKGFEIFKERVTTAGGAILEEAANNNNLEEHFNKVQEALSVALEAKERVTSLLAAIRVGDEGLEAVERIRSIAGTKDIVQSLFRRAKDGFLRERSLLLEEWGRLEDKKLTEQRWKKIDELGFELGDTIAELTTAPAEASLIFSRFQLQSKVGKKGSAETLKETLAQMSSVFPHFAHMSVDEKDNAIVITYSPERFVRITAEGASLWQPVQRQAKGRFGALDVKARGGSLHS